jgi:hypothetical protein
MSKRWYVFSGSDSESYTLNKYRYIPVYPAGCNTGYQVCAVFAAYGGINPAILSDNIQDYIASILLNGVHQPINGAIFALSKTS